VDACRDRERAHTQRAAGQCAAPARPVRSTLQARKGDEIPYEATIEDPDALVEPWVLTPRTMRLNKAPDAGLIPERAYCEVYDSGDISIQIRH
jgi:hypothetical protein